MSIKKTKAKVKGTAKKSSKKSTPKTKKPVDMVRVREDINELVGKAAKGIAIKVIEVAQTTGQLASAKYLFEAAGLYPATEQTAAVPQENSLAFTLLKRMGLPTEPVIAQEELEPIVLGNEVKATCAIAEVTDNDPESEGEQEQEADPGERGE